MGENHRLLDLYRSATLLGISLWMVFLNKINLDWPLTLATQPSTSKLSDNPASGLFVLLIIVFEHSFPLVIQLLARNWIKLIIPVVAFRCVDCLVHTPEVDFVLQQDLL